MLIVTLYVGEGLRGSNGACFPSLPDFSHSPCYPQSNWAPLVLIPGWLGLCTLTCGSPTNSPVRLGVSPTAASTPTGVFNQRFEALFPLCWSPGLRGLLCSPASLVYLCVNVGPRGLLAVALPASSTIRHLTGSSQPLPYLKSSLPHLRVSAPPTSPHEFFFFISLVVRLPYSSIFCPFWLFFVFKLLLSFFWLCEEAQCVYLHLHLGRYLRI